MRALAAALILSLAACLPVPEPRAPAPARAPQGVLPDRGGLQPVGSPLRIDFGRAQAGVIETVSRLQGETPQSIAPSSPCSAGSVVAARWGNGLVLNFRDGDFVGWMVERRGLVVDGGLQVGDAAPSTAGSGLQSNGIWSEVEGGPEIVRLWSGVTCLFR